MLSIATAVGPACSEDRAPPVAVDEPQTDGGDPSRTRLPTGVALLRLSELDAAQAQGTCVAFAARLAEAVGGDAEWVRLACTAIARTVLGGAATADASLDAGTCDELVADCVRSDVVAPVPALDCGEHGLTQAIRACSLTVMSLARCIDAEAARWQAQLSSLSCEAPGREASDPAARDPASLPACELFASDCPELLQRSARVERPPPDAGVAGCSDDCRYASDGECDDGGEGAGTDFCALGTDCSDCGPR